MYLQSVVLCKHIDFYCMERGNDYLKRTNGEDNSKLKNLCLICLSLFRR